MLSKNRKIIGYAIYGIVLALFFLYYRFPSDVFSDYLRGRIKERYPGLDFTAEAVSPYAPISLRFQKPVIRQIGDPDRIIFEGESLVLGPRIISLLKGDRIFHLECAAYKGDIQGDIHYDKDADERPLSVELELKDIQIGDNPAFTDLTGRQIEGALKGSVKYQGKGNDYLKGSGDADLTVSNGLFKLQVPLLGLDAIYFDHINLTMALNNQRISLSRAEIKGPKMQGSASGTISLNSELTKSRMDLRLTVEPLPEMLNEMGSSFESVRRLLKGGKLLITIRGSIKEPRISFG